MFKGMKKFFTTNIALKAIAFLIASFLWFYIVDELNKGNDADREFLQRVLPSGEISARKLAIKPVIVGSPRWGYTVDTRKAIVSPGYCIVVGPKDLLSKIRFAHTMPIEVSNVSQSFTKPVSLSPIAPGIYMDDTSVQVTVVVEKTGGR